MEKTQLEVGDFLVRSNYGRQEYTRITRVTKKQAFAKYSEFGAEHKFDRKLGGGMMAYGKGQTKNWELYNETLHGTTKTRQYLEDTSKRLAMEFSYKKHTNETLQKLIELLTPKE